MEHNIDFISNCGLYIHVPFCKSKCAYCDFYRIIDLGLLDKYVESLICELGSYKDKLSKIDTIYFGGGTPSVLGHKRLDMILKYIIQNYDLSELRELTVECNPENVDDDLIKILSENGVNRISLGVQTLDNNMLKCLGRRHDEKKVYESIDIIRKYGIKNISVDMIFGLPKIGNYEFEKDVEKFVNLDIEHLSIYALSYESGSWLTKLVEKGKIKPLDDDSVADQYSYITKVMCDKGFYHYEISNYSKKGFQSKHNSACWKRIPYIGVGPGASSFDGKKRWSNIPDLEKYVNGNIEKEEDIIDEKDIYNEIVMLGLRTAEGVCIDNIDVKYRSIFLSEANKLIEEGKMMKKNSNYFIKESEWFLLDLITEKFFI